MRYLILPLLIILTSCNSTSHQKQSNEIIADGTEIQQFETMLFCGDKENFTAALSHVGSHLGSAWNSVMGEDNKAECTIGINVDSTGKILDHDFVFCDNPSKLKQVIKKASPVPVPKNECFLQKINTMKFKLKPNKQQ